MLPHPGEMPNRRGKRTPERCLTGEESREGTGERSQVVSILSIWGIHYLARDVDKTQNGGTIRQWTIKKSLVSCKFFYVPPVCCLGRQELATMVDILK